MRPTLRTDVPTSSTARLSRRVLVGLVATAVLVPMATGAAAVDGTAVEDVTLTVEGTLERIMVEHAEGGQEDVGGSEEHVTTVVDVDGTLYEIPEEVVVEGVTGDEVVVTLEADPAMSVEEALEEVAVDEAEDTAAIVSALPAQSGELAAASNDEVLDVTLGTHTLTILPVHWGTADTTTNALSTLATATAQYWNTQSGNRLAVQPDRAPQAGEERFVRNWAQIADPGSCNTTTIWNAAMAAHGNPPVSATQHVLVYFPFRSDCGGWAGQASVGGGKIWVNGSTLVDVSAHELGHNFGLGHANTMTCTVGAGRVPLTTPATQYCTQQSYGDYADVMGIGMNMATGNLNTAFADYLGFASVTSVAASPTAATVQLAPLGSFAALRGVKVTTGEGTVYLDYRPAAAPDVRRTGWAGVQVHLRRMESGVPYTYLLDMQAASTGSTFASPAMPVGATWDVTGTSVRLGVQSQSGSAATVTIGSTSGPTPPPPNDGVERYVTQVYTDLFGRGVDPTGLAGWSNALRSGTPRIAVANAITYSDEYRRGLIQGSYMTYLGRGADPSGGEAWLGQMRIGATIQQMEAGFLASNEYYAQAGGTDAAWIDRLYRHVLGRGPSSADVQSWVAATRASGRYQVAMSFLLSSEHLGDVVDGYYQDLLGRGIDPTGRSQWVLAIQQGSRVEAIIGGIIASDEYFNKR